MYCMEALGRRRYICSKIPIKAEGRTDKNQGSPTPTFKSGDSGRLISLPSCTSFFSSIHAIMVSASNALADDVKKIRDGVKLLLVGDIDPKPFSRYQASTHLIARARGIFFV